MNKYSLFVMAVAGSVSLLACDKDSSGKVEPKEPTLPVSDKALVLPASSIKVGNLGDKLLFTATYVPGGASWVNMSAEIINTGDIKVKIEGTDSVSVNPLGVVSFYSTKGDITAHLEFLKVSDGTKIHDRIDIVTKEFDYLTNDVKLAKDFVNNVLEEPFSIKIRSFKGQLNDYQVVSLLPK